MGWFFSSGSTLPSPKISSDGTPIAPGRNERLKCWEARDAYFQCLDRNNILDSITDKNAAAKACPVEGKDFESNCASSWVQYFKKRRVMEFKKNQTLEKLKAEGASELPPGVGPIPPSGPR